MIIINDSFWLLYSDIFIIPFCTATFIMTCCGIIHLIAPPKIYIKSQLFGSIILSWVNCFLISLLERKKMQNLMIFKYFNVYHNISDYSILWFLLSSIVYMMTTDLLLWVMHYSLHTKYLYLKIHSYHHQYKFPTAFNFISVSPFEMIYAYFTTQFVTLLFPVYYGTMMFYGLLMVIVPILEHGQGMSLLKNINIINKYIDIDVEFHNIHHQLTTVNYGVGIMTSLWDKLLGTLYKDNNKKIEDKKTEIINKQKIEVVV